MVKRISTPTLINFNINSSLQACDRCNQRRRKCSKETPSCKQCVLRDDVCSYDRQLKRFKVLDEKTTNTKNSTKSLENELQVGKERNGSKCNSRVKGKEIDIKIKEYRCVTKPIQQPVQLKKEEVIEELEYINLQPTKLNSNGEGVDEVNSTCYDHNSKPILTQTKDIDKVEDENLIVDRKVYVSEKYNLATVKDFKLVMSIAHHIRRATGNDSIVKLIDYLNYSPLACQPPVFFGVPYSAPPLNTNLLWDTGSPISDISSKSLVSHKDSSNYGKLTSPFQFNLNIPKLRLQQILNDSLDAYFNYINSFTPLFLKTQFCNRPRSLSVLVAIWLCGLPYLKLTDPEELKLREILKTQIIYFLQFSNLKISLSCLQTMLVVLAGIRDFHGLNPLIRLCQNSAIYLAHGLGLHLSSKRKDSYSYNAKAEVKNRLSCMIWQLERKLAYQFIIATDATRGWGLRVPYLKSLDHSTRNPSQFNNSTLIQLEQIAGMHFSNADTGVNNSNSSTVAVPSFLWDVGAIIFSDYSFIKGHHLHQMQMLLTNFVNEHITFTEMRAQVMHIQEASVNTRIKCIKQLNRYENKYFSDFSQERGEIIEVIQAFQHAITTFSHILGYAASSLLLVPTRQTVPLAPSPSSSNLNLSHPNSITFQLNSNSSNSTSAPSYTELNPYDAKLHSLQFTMEAIRASVQLPLDRPYFYHRAFLTTVALAYLANNYDYHPNPNSVKQVFYQGYGYLQELKRRNWDNPVHLAIQKNFELLEPLCKHLLES